MAFFLRDNCIFTDTSNKRDVLLPIRYPTLWKVFKKQQSVIWTTEEIDMAEDLAGFNTLSKESQHFLLTIISFFASSDLLILDNLMEQFMGEVTVPECKAFYALQSFIETIHSETYATMLNIFVPEGNSRYVDGLNQIASIRAKGEWARKYMDAGRPFAVRLWAFCIFEGLLFSASFASIYWLRTKGNLCPGLTFSNELIARDEGLHAEFAIEMYNLLDTPLPVNVVHQVLKEAVALEEAFVREALPKRLEGINASNMCQYVRYCADRLLSLLRGPGGKPYPRLKHHKARRNPYPWMDAISLDSKTNFFEKRVAEYVKANVGESKAETFSMDVDF